MKTNRVLRIIKYFLCNLILILSVVMITLFFLDSYNPLVGFLADDIAKILLLTLSGSGIIFAVIYLCENIRKESKTDTQQE